MVSQVPALDGTSDAVFGTPGILLMLATWYVFVGCGLLLATTPTRNPYFLRTLGWWLVAGGGFFYAAISPVWFWWLPVAIGALVQGWRTARGTTYSHGDDCE